MRMGGVHGSAIVAFCRMAGAEALEEHHERERNKIIQNLCSLEAMGGSNAAAVHANVPVRANLLAENLSKLA